MTIQNRAHSKEFNAENTSQVPPQVQKHIDSLLKLCTQIEKKYYNNPLVPFEQHEKWMKIEATNYFVELRDELKSALLLLKEAFAVDDSHHPEQHLEDAFSVWEKAALFMQNMMEENEALFVQAVNIEPIQEILSIPWPFMDRSFRTAQAFFSEKKYKEAASLYFFLRTLNPRVAEYWFGEGVSLQLQNKFDEAASRYVMGLLLEPHNPLLFLQIGRCLNQLNEKESAIKAVESCIQYAENKEEHVALLKSAKEYKQLLESEMAA